MEVLRRSAPLLHTQDHDPRAHLECKWLNQLTRVQGIRHHFGGEFAVMQGRKAADAQSNDSARLRRR